MLLQIDRVVDRYVLNITGRFSPFVVSLLVVGKIRIDLTDRTWGCQELGSN